MKYLIINGPNLNLTGKREESVYGKETLEDINAYICAYIKKNGDSAEFFQSNIEGEIIDALHKSDADGIILNAGAYTHYSFAIRDAIAAIKVPVTEVHMSNVFSRDDFRHKSVLAEVCKGSVCGFGKNSYILAYMGFKV